MIVADDQFLTFEKMLICVIIFQLSDIYYTDFVSLFDGVCDQTKTIITLTGSLPVNATRVFSTTGHNLFVRFGRGSTVQSSPGFFAKINFGNDIHIMQTDCCHLLLFIN